MLSGRVAWRGVWGGDCVPPGEEPWITGFVCLTFWKTQARGYKGGPHRESSRGFQRGRRFLKEAWWLSIRRKKVFTFPAGSWIPLGHPWASLPPLPSVTQPLGIPFPFILSVQQGPLPAPPAPASFSSLQASPSMRLLLKSPAVSWNTGLAAWGSPVPWLRGVFYESSYDWWLPSPLRERVLGAPLPLSPNSTFPCRLPGITGRGSGWRGPQLSLRWCLCLHIKPGPWINLGKSGEREERKEGGGEREQALRKKNKREFFPHFWEVVWRSEGAVRIMKPGVRNSEPWRRWKSFSAYFPWASERTLKGEELPVGMEFTSLFLFELTLKDASW